MVVSVREYVFVITGSVVVSLLVLAVLWPGVRAIRTLITVALTTAVGIFIWNTALNLTNATSMNVDSPLLGLSAQDVGSGVAAFLVTLLVLRFITNRGESVGRVASVAGIVGLVTVLVDLVG